MRPCIASPRIERRSPLSPPGVSSCWQPCSKLLGTIEGMSLVMLVMNRSQSSSVPGGLPPVITEYVLHYRTAMSGGNLASKPDSELLEERIGFDSRPPQSPPTP